ncbi:cell envelope integrity protein TolA [Cupriavidus sp. AU9028]|nr:cell envelope integrity protein TolA [Cupriavidus sp. AU9028]
MKNADYPYQPVKERGTLRAFLLALFMHLLLGLALYYGINWQISTPAGVEAELWEEIPDVPTPPETPRPPPVAPPAPPRPVVQPRAEEDADIALERQKRREAEQREAARLKEEQARKERQEREEREAAQRKEEQRKEEQRKEAQRKEAQQKEAQRKEEQRKEAQRKEEQRKEEQRKLAEEQKKRDQAREQAEAKAKSEAAAKAKAAKAKADAEAKARQEAANAQRQSELARLKALAGGGAGGGTSGDNVGSGGRASPGYADRVRRRVKPNIVFTEDVPGNPTAVVTVSLAPDGSLLSARLSKSSGNSAWDNAVLRAVERSDPLPRDENGKAPANFTITFRPKD